MSYFVHVQVPGQSKPRKIRVGSASDEADAKKRALAAGFPPGSTVTKVEAAGESVPTVNKIADAREIHDAEQATIKAKNAEAAAKAKEDAGSI